MPASEIIPSHVSASHVTATNTLELYPLRFRQLSPAGRVWTPNILRGAFGSALKRLDEKAYREFFTPTAQSIPRREAPEKLPSGLRDLPRPFVFRLRENEVGINLFRMSSLDLVRAVMSRLNLELAAQPEILSLSLDVPEGVMAEGGQRLRIRFLTPAELKGIHEPAFGPLLTRIRDRISTLRGLYGDGPLDLDFRAFGERADRVSMTRRELQTIEEERVSKRTGQRHAIGGFTGFAEYEGPVAEFLPYLEAARWTGVGRQTVWGKGEIEVELLHD
jgi:hypothetical protein